MIINPWSSDVDYASISGFILSLLYSDSKSEKCLNPCGAGIIYMYIRFQTYFRSIEISLNSIKYFWLMLS